MVHIPLKVFSSFHVLSKLAPLANVLQKHNVVNNTSRLPIGALKNDEQQAVGKSPGDTVTFTQGPHLLY
jgi:hypothetical protein